MISVKTLKGILGCLAAVVVLAGCSSAHKPMEVYTSGQEERQGSGKAGETGAETLEAGEIEPGAMESGLSESERDESQQSGPGNGRESSGTQSETGDLYGRGDRIEEQTFDVTLNPLGQVTFASYRPDTSGNPLADVVFTIEKDGQVILRLPGASEDNVGTELFEQVEAVAFPDYNGDGYDDIIVIIQYCFGAGSQAAQPYSTVRYYRGSGDGTFIYERDMSESGSQALAVITIESAKGFIGAKDKAKTDRAETGGLDSGKTQASWKQAYIDFLDRESHVGEPGGYTLIEMRGDEAPQLVEVGTSEASGCRIIHYSGGKACVTQLNRLGFDYIPGGNLLRNGEGLMDHYYDLIYSIVDGEMKLVASGYYGRDDNAAMEFDAEGNPVYQYEWNGVSMSREEYNRELGKVYDSSKAVTYEYGSLYSADEMKNVIEGY